MRRAVIRHFDRALQPAMVLYIEPGITIPDQGGCCVEDEGIATEDKPMAITGFPTKLW